MEAKDTICSDGLFLIKIANSILYGLFGLFQSFKRPELDHELS